MSENRFENSTTQSSLSSSPVLPSTKTTKNVELNSDISTGITSHQPELYHHQSIQSPNTTADVNLSSNNSWGFEKFENLNLSGTSMKPSMIHVPLTSITVNDNQHYMNGDVEEDITNSTGDDRSSSLSPSSTDLTPSTNSVDNTSTNNASASSSSICLNNNNNNPSIWNDCLMNMKSSEPPTTDVELTTTTMQKKQKFSDQPTFCDIPVEEMLKDTEDSTEVMDEIGLFYDGHENNKDSKNISSQYLLLDDNANDNIDDGDNEDLPGTSITQIKLSDLKTDHSEFPDCILLFIYVSNAQIIKTQFHPNSMSLDFKTNYNLLTQRSSGPENSTTSNNSNLEFIYLLNLNFKREIVPEKCCCKPKKMSLEVRLEKSVKMTWGSIKEICYMNTDVSMANPHFNNNNILNHNLNNLNNNNHNNFNEDNSTTVITSNISTFSPNTWTPCTPQGGKYQSGFNNNNLALIKYTNYRTNNDANNEDEDEEMDISCSSSSLDSSSMTSKRFYGFTGLDNLGNTCFMNSVLQCLANTDPLKDYFLMNKHLSDLNPSNPLGMKGQMAKAFAQFLVQLWMGKQSSFSPHRLKSLIADKAALFTGYSQHDAQEFMSFLLDAIHEDLNQKKKLQNGNHNDDDDKKDEKKDELLDYDANDCPSQEMAVEINNRLRDMANESWNQYRANNSSIIIDLFCGQFKSILTCPDCSKKSIIFDPFLFVPLPIPPPKLLYNVIYFARDETSDMCKAVSRFSIKIAQNSTVNDFLDKICQQQIIPNRNVRLMQQQQSDAMPVKFFNYNWVLADHYQQPQAQAHHYGVFSNLNNNDYSNQRYLSNSQPLLLFELPEKENDSNNNVQQNKDDKESTKYVELCVVQRELHHNQSERFQVGFPFIVSIRQSCLTYSHLCAVLCSYARFSVVAYRQTPPAAQQFENDNNNPTSNGGQKMSNIQRSLAINRFNVHSFTPKNYSKNSRLVNPINSSNPNTNELPHLVHPATKNLEERDTEAPFLIRALSFNSKEPDKDIMPISNVAEIFETSNCNNNSTNLDSDDNEFIDETDGPEEPEEDQQNDQSNDMQNEEESVLDINETTASLVIHSCQNDLLLDLSGNYFMAMDWITTKHFNTVFSVELSPLDRGLEYDKVISDDDDLFTLNDCLQGFIEPEVLGPMNCWRCPNCKVLREASKQLSFWRLPPILVIQLKRFKTHLNHHEKLNFLVKYPLQELDLRKYYTNFECLDRNGENVEPVYDLYAVVNHQGSAFWGHYTAFARPSHSNNLGWRLFDDCSVEKVDEDSIVTSRAYILFYRRRQQPKNKPIEFHT